MYYLFLNLFLLINIFSNACLKAYEVKDFSYLLSKTQSINEATLKMHLQLYEGYVKNTNQIISLIKEMEDKDQGRTLGFGALKRRFGWEFDGMRLHELYFENLGGDGLLSQKSPLYMEIEKNFNTFGDWKKNFISTGLIRGIGWVILYKDPIDGHLFNVWVNEHEVSHLAGGKPLLVMDVWEHAYITQYGLDRAKYIEGFLKEVNWSVVQQRASSK